MAFSSQFSLSLELTRLLPLGGAVEAGGRALIQLARELQRSGSDIVVEEDLAEVFGRNRIEPHFESTFRTAVRDSSIVQLPRLLDIILEAGAGPTVRRSVNNRIYLSSVIQLSLLTFAHQLDSLAISLGKALAQRKAGSDDFVNVPRYDVLLGTLRAIRDQTSGFPWDWLFDATDAQIYEKTHHHIDLDDMRRVPFAVLQGLLDILTAIQHFPKHKFARIRTYSGISTLIIWTHNILGMTVSVTRASETIAEFGGGSEKISIEWMTRRQGYAPEGVELLTSLDSDEPYFSLSTNAMEDPHLTSVCRHAVNGFATKKMQICEDLGSIGLQVNFAQLIIAFCIGSAQTEKASAGPLAARDTLIPSKGRIISACELLFNGTPFSLRVIENLMRHPTLNENCQRGGLDLPIFDELELFEPSTPRIPRGGSFHDWSEADCRIAERLATLAENLCRVIFAVVAITNLSECGDMPLDLNTLDRKGSNGMWFSPKTAWGHLMILMHGPNAPDLNRDEKARQSCIMSNMGWSLVLGCVEPGELYSTPNEIIAHRGVPTRNQERKSWVIDLNPQGAFFPMNKGDVGQHHVEYTAGQHMRLDTATFAKFLKPLVGVTDNAFTVVQRIELSPKSLDRAQDVYASTGFRELQELCWKAILLPNCAHGSQIGERVEVPEGCVAFSGWLPKLPGGQDHVWEQVVPIQLAMTVGDEAAKWALLLATGLWNRRRYLSDKNITGVTYLKPSGCCVSCAVETVRADRIETPKAIIL